MDTTRSLVLIPRDAGATHKTVLGKDGKVIMQRYVIVAAPAEKYIRIRRACSGNAGTCVQTSVYYCPDMCHETKMLTSTLGQQQTPPAPLSSGASPEMESGGETGGETQGAVEQENSAPAPEQAPEPVIENNEAVPAQE
jgi:hypothetical protein